MKAENLLIVNDLLAELIERIVAEVVKQIDPRFIALDKDSTEVANTLHGVNTALDTLSDRLETAIDDDGKISSNRIKTLIEAALENYDPTDYHGFERAVEGVIDDYPLKEQIKEAIGDMDFQITVR